MQHKVKRGRDADKYKFIGNYSGDTEELPYNDIVIQHNYDTFIGLITTQAGPPKRPYIYIRIVAPVDGPMNGLRTGSGV